MALKDRLDTLRRQSGTTPEAADTQRSSLTSRLDRLGARVQGRHAQPGCDRAEVDIEQLAGELGARVVSEHLLCRESVVAPDAASELAAMGTAEPVLSGNRVADPEGLLIVDTETSGLAGGAGTLAFMIGLLRLEGSELVCRQYLLTGFGGEPALYHCLADEAARASVVVSYNGKSFDAPLIRDRACVNRTPSPLVALDHVDLLTAVRRLFATNWPDCRLTTAEVRLLGGGRGDDLPGDQAPVAWFDFIHRGATERLPGVLDHNRHDLVSLAQLLPLIAGAHVRPLAFGADPWGAARAWQRAGEEGRARRLLAACESHLDNRALLELARLARRNGDQETAVRVWRGLAERGNDDAVEALAKHYEHRALDYDAALDWARRLGGEQAAIRCRRLEAKQAASGRQVELGL